MFDVSMSTSQCQYWQTWYLTWVPISCESKTLYRLIHSGVKPPSPEIRICSVLTTISNYPTQTQTQMLIPFHIHTKTTLKNNTVNIYWPTPNIPKHTNSFISNPPIVVSYSSLKKHPAHQPHPVVESKARGFDLRTKEIGATCGGVATACQMGCFLSCT